MKEYEWAMAVIIDYRKLLALAPSVAFWLGVCGAELPAIISTAASFIGQLS